VYIYGSVSKFVLEINVAKLQILGKVYEWASDECYIYYNDN
jgi:hypothetical protein